MWIVRKQKGGMCNVEVYTKSNQSELQLKRS